MILPSTNEVPIHTSLRNCLEKSQNCTFCIYLNLLLFAVSISVMVELPEIVTFSTYLINERSCMILSLWQLCRCSDGNIQSKIYYFISDAVVSASG